MDTALPQKFPFILDRNLAKANCTENHVCTSCDKVVLGLCLMIFDLLRCSTASYLACLYFADFRIPRRVFQESREFTGCETRRTGEGIGRGFLPDFIPCCHSRVSFCTLKKTFILCDCISFLVNF